MANTKAIAKQYCITIVLITAVIVFALDVVFESMNTYGIDKLKAVVDTTNETTNTTDTNQLISIDDASNTDTSGENATDSDTTTNETDGEADSTNTENTNNVEE